MFFSYLFLLLFALTPLAPAHDLPLGIITITMESGELVMELKFDKEDLERAVSGKSHNHLQPAQLKNYIIEHTQLRINDQILSFNITSFAHDAEHYDIRAVAVHLPERAQSMRIYNACLIDEISNHSNIIYLHYAGRRRGFRLHKDRLFTQFDL